MRRNLRVTILVLLMTTMLCAHGNEQHVMGTVANITETAITVKTRDGNSVEVFIGQETKFMRGGQPISAKDVKQGDRIVIHANEKGKKLTATNVAIGKTNEGEPKGEASAHDEKSATTLKSRLAGRK